MLAMVLLLITLALLMTSVTHSPTLSGSPSFVRSFQFYDTAKDTLFLLLPDGDIILVL